MINCYERQESRLNEITYCNRDDKNEQQQPTCHLSGLLHTLRNSALHAFDTLGDPRVELHIHAFDTLGDPRVELHIPRGVSFLTFPSPSRSCGSHDVDIIPDDVDLIVHPLINSGLPLLRLPSQSGARGSNLIDLLLDFVSAFGARFLNPLLKFPSPGVR
jgi:hypothetical protein